MIKVLIFGLLLGLLAAFIAASDGVHAQRPPDLVGDALDSWDDTNERAAIFSWGKDCAVTMVRDLTDWDVNPTTGERYFVLQSIEYSCPFDRDVSFDFRLKEDNFKRTTTVAKEVKTAFSIPLWISRVTEENFAWNFTPAHVDVVKGSVSNPSLLTAGGNATTNGLDASAVVAPTANGLIVLGWGVRQPTANDNTFTFTTTLVGQGAWSAVQAQAGTYMTHQQAYSQTGAAPLTGTITNTYGGTNPTRKAWVIAEVTGHNTSTPLSESNTGGAATGTSLDIALGGIAAGNMAIGTVTVRGTAPVAITPGTNETEVTGGEANSGGAGSTSQTTEMEYGTSDTNINWTWSGTNENTGVAIEYAQAGGGAAAAQVIMVD